jgi:hypothetical protein
MVITLSLVFMMEMITLLEGLILYIIQRVIPDGVWQRL